MIALSNGVSDMSLDITRNHYFSPLLVAQELPQLHTQTIVRGYVVALASSAMQLNTINALPLCVGEELPHGFIVTSHSIDGSTKEEAC